MKYLFIFIFFFVTHISAQDHQKEPPKDGHYFFGLMTKEIINGSIENALIQAANAADEFNKAQDWPMHIYSLCALAGLNFDKGDYSNFFVYTDSINALVDNKLTVGDETFYIAKNTIARRLLIEGRVSDVIKLLEPLLGQLQDLENAFLRSALNEKLVEAYILRGDYFKAKEVLNPSITNNEDLFARAKYFQLLATINSKEGNHISALEQINESIAFLQNVPKSESTKVLMNSCILSKAESLLKLGRLNETVKCLNPLDIDLDKVKPKSKAKYYLVQSKIKFALKNMDEAYRYAELASQTMDNTYSKSAASKYDLFEYTEMLHKVYMSQDKYLESEKVIRRGLEDVGIKYENLTVKNIHVYNFESCIALLRLLAQNKKSQFQKTNKHVLIDESLELYEEIIRLIDLMSIDNSDASYIKFWAGKNQEIYEEAILIAIISGNEHKVFSFIEENKSNLLSQSVVEALSKEAAQVPLELLDNEKKLRARLRSLRKSIEQRNTLVSNNTDSTIVSLSSELNVLQFELDNHIDKIEKDYPEFYSLKYKNERIEITDIQKLLGKNSIFLEYFIGSQDAYVYFISKKKSKLVKLNQANVFKKRIEEINLALRNKNENFEEKRTISKELYDFLIGPISNEINTNVEDLIIVADDKLTNFPFEILSTPEHKYLNDKYNIHYQYSGKLWKLLTSRELAPKNYNLLTYAYTQTGSLFKSERSCNDTKLSNLYCSEKEIESIHQAITDKSVLKLESSKSTLFENVRKGQILHLATHSCLNETDPSLSRIYLEEDYLTLNEIQNENLNLELAVISSCESGYGKVVRGEGSMSISKGFFQAGCSSTLVSLWPVDDCSTSDVMSAFYSNLNKGLSKSKSLQLAKSSYLKTAHPSKMHPYYWAGFILVGDNKAIWNESIWTNQVLALAILLVVLLCLIFAFRNRLKSK